MNKINAFKRIGIAALLAIAPLSLAAMEQTVPTQEQIPASKHTLKNYALGGLGVAFGGCFYEYNEYRKFYAKGLAEELAKAKVDVNWYVLRGTKHRNIAIASGLVSSFFLYNLLTNLAEKKLSFKASISIVDKV